MEKSIFVVSSAIKIKPFEFVQRRSASPIILLQDLDDLNYFTQEGVGDLEYSKRKKPELLTHTQY